MPHKFIVDDHVDITETSGTYFAQRMIKHPIQNETLKEKIEILSDFILEYPSININSALNAYRSIIELIADINESQKSFDDFIQQILAFEGLLRSNYQVQTPELTIDESNLLIYQKIVTQNDEFYPKMFDKAFMNSILNKEQLSHFEYFCICHYLQHANNISKELFKALSLKFITFSINLMIDYDRSSQIYNMRLPFIQPETSIDPYVSIQPSFEKTLLDINFLNLVKSYELFLIILKKMHELSSVNSNMRQDFTYYIKFQNLITEYCKSFPGADNKPGLGNGNRLNKTITAGFDNDKDFKEIARSVAEELSSDEHDDTFITMPYKHAKTPPLNSLIPQVTIYAHTNFSDKNNTTEEYILTDEETTQLYSRDGLDVYPMVVDKRYKLSFEQSDENEIHRASLTVDYTEMTDSPAFVIINMIENILAHGKGRLNITTNHLESALIADAYFQKLISKNDAFDDINYRNPLAKNAPPEKKEQYMKKIERYWKHLNKEQNHMENRPWYKAAVTNLDNPEETNRYSYHF